MCTLNGKGKRISDSWHGRTNTVLQCPIPGCEHKGEIITKAHLRLHHGMERNEVKEKYGMPIVLDMKEGFNKQLNYNMLNSISNSSAFVYKNSFMTLYRKVR